MHYIPVLKSKLIMPELPENFMFSERLENSRLHGCPGSQCMRMPGTENNPRHLLFSPAGLPAFLNTGTV